MTKKDLPPHERPALDILKETGGLPREAGDADKKAHRRKRTRMFREHDIPPPAGDED